MHEGSAVASPESDEVLDLAAYEGLPDFTRYICATDASSANEKNVAKIKALLSSQSKSANSTDAAYSYSENIYPTSGGAFRSLICPCFQGRHYSITLRELPEGESQGLKQSGQKPTSYEAVRNKPWLDEHKPASHFSVTKKSEIKEAADEKGKSEGKNESQKYLFELHESVDILFRRIFKPAPNKLEEHAGLVVVAGATSSGKSRIVRGIIHEYLCELVRKRTADGAEACKPRRPHLITFEDPIEAFYYDDPKTALEYGLDYTPRQKGKDVGNLTEFLRDCLRQTPAVVYVGETRIIKDWKKLVDFAGTGHLVFTTCHAGSLTEVVGTLCRAMEANTAAKRGSLAARLAGVIQLRRATLDFDPNKKIPVMETVLPALLTKTPTGINALTGDGLSALLPHSVAKAQEVPRYCYGRAYFADELLGAAKNKLLGRCEKSQEYVDSYSERLKKLAFQFDLEGL